MADHTVEKEVPPTTSSLGAADGEHKERPLNGSSTPGSPIAPSPSTPSEDAPTKSSLKGKIASKLPPWVIEALHSRRTWKNWIRSMIATFITMLFLVITPVMNAMGQAAFFGLIASQMLPPMFPVSFLLFALLTMGFGMLFGWAWGCAAWAAGLNVRNQALLQSQQQAVQAAMNPNIDPSLQLQLAMFKGQFLDPRCSAVHGAFIFIGAYFLGWLRATKPNLLLMTIFAVIVMDSEFWSRMCLIAVMCSFGPLFPIARYTLASTLIKPAAIYMGVAVLCALIFFPQTVNHLVMSGLVHKTLKPMMAMLKVQDDMLVTSPLDEEAWRELAKRTTANGTAFLTAFQGLEGMAKMLQLEVSRGRISAGQLSELLKRTRVLAGRALGLGTTIEMVEERHDAWEAQLKQTTSRTQLRKKAVIERYTTVEEETGRNFADLLPQLKECTAELRAACESGFQGGIDYLDMINNSRWKKSPADFPGIAVRKANLERLRVAVEAFRKLGHHSIITQFRDYFDPETGKLRHQHRGRPTTGSRGLFRCFQFMATYTSFGSALIDWLSLLEVIELENPKNKLQLPGRFINEVVRNVSETHTGDNDYDLTQQNDLVEDHDSTHNDSTLHSRRDERWRKRHPKAGAHDPDAGPARNSFQRAGRVISVVVRAAMSDSGIFALKHGLVTIALWVPQVIPSSAEFTYMNRGLWALIMAQTGLGMFTGEQVYNFVTRMSGTCIGVVIGMVIWYIGAQKGLGEAYGVTAATMVGIAPFLFLRIAAPPHAMAIYVMVTVTIVFVVGYSWADNHIQQSANQGAGATLAGRRALLVLVGFGAAFVMCLFPRPVSAKKVVRQGLAKNIGALGDLYALEITGLEHARAENITEIDPVKRWDIYRGDFLRIFGRIQSLKQRILFASFEPAMRGPWPKDKYTKLVRVQESMLGASALLTTAYSQLEPKWSARITDHSVLMNPAFTADCFALFTMLRHSLRLGQPLPPIIPIFERLSYTFTSHERRAAEFAKHHEGSREVDPLTLNLLPTEQAALEAFRHDLTWARAHDEQFIIYATALIALSHLVGGLNELHRVVLSLVGEREIEGFDLSQERWAQEHFEV